MAVAGECMQEFPTVTIGLLLQYFISKPIKDSPGKAIKYILVIIVMMSMISK